MTGLQKQQNLFLTVNTAAGEDKFIITKMEGEEAISELFEFRVDLYSMTAVNADAVSIDFNTILQQDATVTIIQKDTQKRYFQGIVTSIMQGPTVAVSGDTETISTSHEKTYFKMTIRPKMWLLTLRENCRIFQKKTTIAIIKEVLGEHSVTIEDKTSNAGVAIREYCVQYNESDFAFVSRLMEAEGIYYFFNHTATGHTLVLFDGSKPYVACPVTPTVNVLNPLLPGFLDMGIRELHVHQQVISDACTLKDYSFEHPATDLKAQATGDTQLLGVYNYPGNYTVQAIGEKVASRRLDAIEVTQCMLSGTANVPFLMPGYSFKLMKATRAALNSLEYVVLKVQHYAEIKENLPHVYEGEDTLPLIQDKSVEDVYENTFACFPKLTTYRPLLKTPKPRIYGTQTATVTGKTQEEIWTDKYGRVLVKFPWDLSDTVNEKTSCWIRVMLPWTGQGWGMQFVPRVGQEVVVTFLNGDPDYPLITGCVYNSNNLPPYLPGEPTKSAIKTNSSKQVNGETTYNELRFEDKKNSEEVYIRAQKDLNVDVFDGNRTTTLKAAKNKKVKDTLTITKGDRVKTLTEGNETVTLTKGNRSVTLTEGSDTLTLTKGNRITTLNSGNETLTLSQGNRTVKITGTQSHDISQNCTLKVGGNLTIEVTGNITMKGQAISISCTTFDLKASASASIKTATMTLKADATANITAGATMTVKGEAQATFQSSAMVNIKGAMLNAEGSAMATLKGAMATVEGSAMGALKGGIVMIG